MSIPLEDIDSPIEESNQQNESSVERKSRWQIIKNEIRQLLTFHPREWLNAFRFNSSYPLFVKGDIDAFVALFINNLATLLAVILSLQPVLGNEIIFGKIVPGYVSVRKYMGQIYVQGVFLSTLELDYPCSGVIFTTFIWLENWRLKKNAVMYV